MSNRDIALALRRKVECQNMHPIRSRQNMQAPTGYGHLLWMLDGIIGGWVTGAKAQRWFGFVEGVLVHKGLTSVDALRQLHSESGS